MSQAGSLVLLVAEDIRVTRNSVQTVEQGCYNSVTKLVVMAMPER